MSLSYYSLVKNGDLGIDGMGKTVSSTLSDRFSVVQNRFLLQFNSLFLAVFTVLFSRGERVLSSRLLFREIVCQGGLLLSPVIKTNIHYSSLDRYE